jgi:hypothetical protein
MTPKARINDDLLLVPGLGKLEQKNLGGQIVDVGQAEGGNGLVELVGDDLTGACVSGGIQVGRWEPGR